MAVYALLAKDLREHRAAALFLGGACLIVVMLLLAQNSAAAYSMSSFEIVRFSLVTFLPLIALIVGNRLIVNEYMSGTRLFVEALPVGIAVPLVLKYLLGFSYISLIASFMVLLAGRHSGIADDVTLEYMLLILAKTLVIVALYWSIVFCFSLCGYLRIALYLITVVIVAVLAYYPGLDASSFPPMALMDEQLFVFERDVIPRKDMGLTLLCSLFFAVTGFILTKIGEGSVIERLAKPMTRRDYVAIGVLAASGLAVAATLVDDNQREPIDFSSVNAIRLNDPDVSVLHIAEEYEVQAKELATSIFDSLTQLQATLALQRLPTVRLVLSPNRDKYELDYSTLDGVLISANWLEHDSYDDAILASVIMHGVLSAQTNGRSVFEPYHWVLDGFTRWWVEQGTQPLNADHRDELVARALLTIEREPRARQLIERWQLTADQFAYPSAEALAWAAMNYLEETRGRESVIRLASEFLTIPAGSSAFATFKDRSSKAEERAENIIGMPLEQFHEGWVQWLQDQATSPSVQHFMSSVPAVRGVIANVQDASGVKTIQASYEPMSQWSGVVEELETLPGVCVMKHDYIGPFDMEFDVSAENEDVALCQVDGLAHEIKSSYASGDRAFVALDYEGGLFHQPFRLHAQRLYVP